MTTGMDEQQRYRRSFRIPAALQRDIRAVLYLLRRRGDMQRPRDLLHRALEELLEEERRLARKALSHGFKRTATVRRELQKIADVSAREREMLDHRAAQAVDGLMEGYLAEKRWRRTMRDLRAEDERADRKRRGSTGGKASRSVVSQVFYIDEARWKAFRSEVEQLRRQSGRWWPGLYQKGVPDGFWIYTALTRLVERVKREAGGTLPDIPEGPLPWGGGTGAAAPAAQAVSNSASVDSSPLANQRSGTEPEMETRAPRLPAGR
jgi:hypothetical protein